MATLASGRRGGSSSGTASEWGISHRSAREMMAEIERLRADKNRAIEMIAELERHGTIDHAVAFELLHALGGGYEQKASDS